MALNELQQLQLVAFLRCIGCAVGGTIIALGMYFYAINDSSEIKDIVLQIYRIFFGGLIILAEFRMRRFLAWFSFLVYFIGIGFFYVFVAGFALGDEWYEWLLAIIAFGVGVTYCCVGICCSGVEETAQNKIARESEEIRQSIA